MRTSTFGDDLRRWRVERLGGVLDLNGFDVVDVTRANPQGRPTAVVFAEPSDW